MELKGRHAGRKSHQLSENSLDSLHRMWTPQDRKYTSPPQVMHGVTGREGTFLSALEILFKAVARESIVAEEEEQLYWMKKSIWKTSAIKSINCCCECSWQLQSGVSVLHWRSWLLFGAVLTSYSQMSLSRTLCQLFEELNLALNLLCRLRLFENDLNVCCGVFSRMGGRGQLLNLSHVLLHEAYCDMLIWSM